MPNKRKLGKNPLEKKSAQQFTDFPHTTLFKEVVKPLSGLERIKQLEIKVDWPELVTEVFGKKWGTKVAKIISVFVAAILLSSCNTPQKDEADLKKQLVELQKLQAKQASQIEELNTKILLLGSQKAQPAPAPAAPVAAETKGGDIKIYERAIKDLKNKSFESFKKNTELLAKGFKDSPLTNNAMFLLGDAYFKKSDFANAAKTFEKLYSSNPDGNRAVSTLYFLGLSYQKLGRTQEAKEAFQSIVNIYPGSREAVASAKKLASYSQRRNH